MTRILPSQTRKVLGYALVVLCISFLGFSLVKYLFTAYPCIESIERPYSHDVYLEGGKSFDLWYYLHDRANQSEFVLNESLHITFEVTGDEVIDFYLMSNSQYEEWKNGSAALGIIDVPATDHEDLLFIPPIEDRYYLVLNNIPYNASKFINFQSIWVATVNLVNYSEAFSWLKISLISLALLITGSFLLKNPIGLVSRELQGFACLKEVRKIRGQRGVRTDIDLRMKFFWSALSLLTAVAFGVLTYRFVGTIQSYQESPELFPMLADIFIRMFLYYEFAFVSLSFFSLFWLWLIEFVCDLDLLYYVKVKKRKWNPELRWRSFQISKGILISLESAEYYIVALILFVAGCFLAEFRFPLFVGSTFVFSVAVSRAVFYSFRKSCDELKLKWTDELKRDMPFAVNAVTITIFLIPIFLLSLRMIFPVVLDILDIFTINSFPGPLFQEVFHEIIDPRTTFFETLGLITSDAVLFGSLLFLLIVIITYYLLPEIDRKLTIKSKLKSLVTPAIAAILAFATNEVYFMWVTPVYSGREKWSILISFTAFGASYLAGKAYEEAMK